jgi:hypothetical protein
MIAVRCMYALLPWQCRSKNQRDRYEEQQQIRGDVESRRKDHMVIVRRALFYYVACVRNAMVVVKAWPGLGEQHLTNLDGHFPILRRIRRAPKEHEQYHDKHVT